MDMVEKILALSREMPSKHGGFGPDVILAHVSAHKVLLGELMQLVRFPDSSRVSPTRAAHFTGIPIRVYRDDAELTRMVAQERWRGRQVLILKETTTPTERTDDE